jgi:predicted Holliday junction resolvase-like endonuclease
LDKVKEQADKAKVQAQELKEKVGERVDDVRKAQVRRSAG